MSPPVPRVAQVSTALRNGEESPLEKVAKQQRSGSGVVNIAIIENGRPICDATVAVW